ncbi:unnamed protein product, partial [Polarella glacialis]
MAGPLEPPRRQVAPVLGLPSCEFLRSWPSNWSLTSLVKEGIDGRSKPGDAVLPGPSRFLHASLELRVDAIRGRCLVASSALKAGELVLADAPLLTSPSKE